MITNLPGATKMKPGSVGLPFFGSTPVILNPKTGLPIEGPAQGALAFARPWPGMAATVFGDHERFVFIFIFVFFYLFMYIVNFLQLV
jgi:acetyl-CoA synthetase